MNLACLQYAIVRGSSLLLQVHEKKSSFLSLQLAHVCCDVEVARERRKKKGASLLSLLDCGHCLPVFVLLLLFL